MSDYYFNYRSPDMTQSEIISIHRFEQDVPGSNSGAMEIVYLKIDHMMCTFDILPIRPMFEEVHSHRGQNFASISDVAFGYNCISSDYLRYIALQQCIFRAIMYATGVLGISTPEQRTEICDEFIQRTVSFSYPAPSNNIIK